MAKRRISVSIDEGLIKQLDGITENRSGFIQALIEGALKGFKTFLVPKDYQAPRKTYSPTPPPVPSASVVEEEDEFTKAGKAALAKRKEKKALAITPEQIALDGAREGVTSQLENIFRMHRIEADMASGDIREMRKEMFKMIQANKD